MRLNTNGNMFNGVVAGFLAASVAFAAFAMPDWRLAQLVDFFGLASVLSAAQPPLGNTARLCVMLFGAIVTFASIWLVLRAFDPPAAVADDFADLRKARDIDIDNYSRPAPRVRRADSHPDAPAPRPISATHDFGEPEWQSRPAADFTVPILQDEAALEQAGSSDELLDSEPRIFARLRALREEAGVSAVEPVQDADTAEAETVAADVPFVPETLDIAQSAPEFVQDEPAEADDEGLLELGAEHVDLNAGIEDDDGPDFLELGAEPDMEIEAPGSDDLLELGADNRIEFDAEAFEPAPSTGDLVAKLPIAEESSATISNLLSRLDGGLGSVEWPLAAASPTVSRRRGGERLSSMISDLQKMASRNR